MEFHRAAHRISAQARDAEQGQRADALCAETFWPLRGHRFSGGAFRLCHQRRTHSGGVLRFDSLHGGSIQTGTLQL